MMAVVHVGEDGKSGTLVISVYDYERHGGAHEVTLPVRDIGQGTWRMGLIDMPLPEGACVSVMEDIGRLEVSGPLGDAMYRHRGEVQYQPWGQWFVEECRAIKGRAVAGTLAEAVKLILDARDYPR
jgi:hypothetical protein